ncbi:MAG TPA: efflux RND transporter periplasmic adaptor subunit [Vicinamibacterales bacterium]|nr:efflux RND transporter periplasmic adaptor subunit [Vicinamibacterales bacterium]
MPSVWPRLTLPDLGLGMRRACRLSGPLAALLAALSCAAQPPTSKPGTPQSAADADNQGIGCLGRVEPGDGVVLIAARSLTGQPSIVGRLLVNEGDAVQVNQVIAELDSRSQLEAAERQAQARIDVARRRLDQVQAGAKPSDVAAQQAEVERWQVELETAQKEYQRYASLGNNVTASQVDGLRARVDISTRALDQARQRLNSLSEVRPADVELVRAELQEAIQNKALARAESEASLLRSPINGRVIKIHARPGAAVGADGVFELAPNEPMYVVAEIPEGDIARVRVGQRARISGKGLVGPIQGTVERIGLLVQQKQVLPADPAMFSDGRVVDAWIKVDDARAVQRLIHLRVNVVIQL